MIPVPDRLSLKFIVGIAAALMLGLLVADRNRWKAKTQLYSALLAGERAAHLSTVANYRAAAERARRADVANAKRVKTEQDAINERTAHDFQTRLAAARAHAERLRREARAETDSRAGGAAPAPGLSASSGGVAEAAGKDGFPRADALIASEQAIQLDELIKWVRRQAAVPQSGGPGEWQAGEGAAAQPAVEQTARLLPHLPVLAERIDDEDRGEDQSDPEQPVHGRAH